MTPPDNKWPARSLMLVLAALAALATLSTNIMLPAFPGIAHGLDVPVEAMGATFTVFFFGFAITQLFVGPLSDRYGRQPVAIAGVALVIAGSIVCAVAPSFPVLLVGRVVQSLGAAATSVIARAVARDRFEGESLTRVMAFVMVAMAAAPGFSPLFGGALETWLGWRSIFLAVAVVTVLVALGYALLVGETLSPSRRRVLSPPAIARDYCSLAAERPFILPALAISLTIGSLYAVFAASPRILMIEHGLDPQQFGWYFAGTVIVVFAAGAAAPRLATRFGAERALQAGLVTGLAGSIAMLGLEALGMATLATYTATLCLFLLGMGVANPVGTAVALGPVGNRAGQASALLGFLQMAMAGIGAGIAGALPMAPVGALGLVMSIAMAVAVLAFGLRDRSRVATRAAPGA